MNPWFGRKSTSQLAAQQLASNKGRSPVVNTMIAAYKQFDDIEWLLKNLQQPEVDVVKEKEIIERHEKYREASANEDVAVK